MELVSYSFIAMLLHSIWQAALFYVIYRISIFSFHIQSPHTRRNGLLLIFPFLLACSLLTFFYYFFNINISAFSDVNFPEKLVSIDKSSLLSYSPYVLLFYFLLLLIKGNYILMSWRKNKINYQKSLQKAPAAIRLFTKQAAHHFGIKNVQVWLSNTVVIPCTMGFLKPVILFPLALASSLTADEIESILLHELAHIRQKDYFFNWLILFAETIYFFNPFVYIISRHVKLEREKCCDLQVLNFGYNPIMYATALFKTAQFNQRHYAFQLAASSSKPLLLKRIHFFTGYNNLSKGRHHFIFPLAFLFLTTLISIVPFTKTGNHTKYPTAKTNILIPVAMPHTTPVNREEEDINKKYIENHAKKIITRQIASTQPRPFREAEIRTPNNKFDDPPVYNQSLFIPVSLTAHSKDSAREVFVREQTNNGTIITKCYKVSFRNDEWNLTLLWIAKEKIKNIKDTLITGREDTLRMPGSNIQRVPKESQKPIVDIDE